MARKQKKLRLSDEDLSLLDALVTEVRDAGLAGVNDSDIVSLGLKELKKHGGAIEVLKKRKKEGVA